MDFTQPIVQAYRFDLERSLGDAEVGAVVVAHRRARRSQRAHATRRHLAIITAHFSRAARLQRSSEAIAGGTWSKLPNRGGELGSASTSGSR